ncbi:single-stranded DNA-binding protein [Candidatus Uhrbacteria bacterium CG10_big_fil_rev_8_21_14_0_10_48_16]|uniref:Single-stranded DNA-binding protein n=1 Tax=Candidatus Uhrbacteria bacterium CG10_big_fil_rev_8_21_14_0_10_48_16 TaxID=1975038 RepID=A0A2M8LI08_9BACT|nr:MAG: single-stranded DNA-binding protein [Candidatus Uhrbacteria bacterium CG10_big_fil_rev_8_21_14_0_10_48_16]
MYSLNRATVIGNLTREPETRQTPSGQNVCTFSVATNRTWASPDGKKQEATEFHNVVAWGKLADICAQYLNKGRKVYIEGRLQTRDWEGQDGVRRYRTEIVTENMIILDKTGGAPSGSVNASSVGSFGDASFTPPSPPTQDDPAPNPDDEIKIEDIPF